MAVAIIAASSSAAFAMCNRNGDPKVVSACLNKENQATIKQLKVEYNTMFAAFEKDCIGKFNVVTPTSDRDVAACVSDKLAAEKKRMGMQ